MRIRECWKYYKIIYEYTSCTCLMLLCNLIRECGHTIDGIIKLVLSWRVSLFTTGNSATYGFETILCPAHANDPLNSSLHWIFEYSAFIPRTAYGPNEKVTINKACALVTNILKKCSHLHECKQEKIIELLY